METQWFAAPDSAPALMHGVMINETQVEFRFALPAHTLATLTVVLRGALSCLTGPGRWEIMPRRFASGSRWRSTHFCATPNSLWVSLIARADAWPILSGKSGTNYSNRFFDPALIGAAGTSHQVKFLDDEEFSGWPTKAPALAGYLLSAMIGALGCSKSRPATSLLNAALAGLRAHDLPRVWSDLAVSERRLQRLFRSELGASAKMVERLLRLHRAVSIWDKRSSADFALADLALSAGYSDQAHMTNGLARRCVMSENYKTACSVAF